jgi:acyl carrier protein
VQHLNLVIALEQAFGVSFAPEEIEKMQNLTAIVQVIQAKR